MKKLKIFLLLSILLCFGFALSPEVHAQGNGPKILEKDDVLPATTQLRLTVDFNNMEEDDVINFITTNSYIMGSAKLLSSGDESFLKVDSNDITLTSSQNKIHIYDLDTSSLTEAQRTVISDYKSGSGYGYWTWEDLNALPQGFNITFEENGGTLVTDLNEQTALPDPLPIPTKVNYIFLGWYYDSDFTNEAFANDPLTDDVILYAKWGSGTQGYGPKLFEVYDVLPATTQLRIRWIGDITMVTGSYRSITTDNGSFELIYTADNYLSLYIMNEEIYDDDHGVFISPYTNYDGDHAYIDIDTSTWDINKRTIYSVDTDMDIFTWVDMNSVYQAGYTAGYLAGRAQFGWKEDGYWYSGEEAWNLGNASAREIYGYYDPITEQWLSVEEYLELYGTDKTGASDFYNNFDKYFIPAMIIVFGGAIVLTILKVFKGRE